MPLYFYHAKELQQLRELQQQLREVSLPIFLFLWVGDEMSLPILLFLWVGDEVSLPIFLFLWVGLYASVFLSCKGAVKEAEEKILTVKAVKKQKHMLSESCIRELCCLFSC